MPTGRKQQVIDAITRDCATHGVELREYECYYTPYGKGEVTVVVGDTEIRVDKAVWRTKMPKDWIVKKYFRRPPPVMDAGCLPGARGEPDPGYYGHSEHKTLAAACAKVGDHASLLIEKANESDTWGER